MSISALAKEDTVAKASMQMERIKVSHALCAHLCLGKSGEATHIGGESEQGLTCIVYQSLSWHTVVRAFTQVQRVNKGSPALCADE